MKKLFSLILLMPMFMKAQKGIKFEEGLTWKQVLQKAKDENKYIFLDCYATWCGPCKVMDNSVYSLQNVGNYYNDKFISVKVQMDSSKLDDDFVKIWYADASMIKDKYRVSAFPTYLFFSPNGDVVHRADGVYEPEYFIEVGSDAINSNKQYYTALQKYRRNELDHAYMKTLARNIKRIEGNELAQKVANEYIDRLPIDSLFTKDNIHFISEFTNSSKDRGFAMFRDCSKRISETDERISAQICRNMVLGIINKEEIKPYRSIINGKPDWKKIKSNLKKYGPLGEEAYMRYKPGIIFNTEIEPALKTNSDWSKILPLIKKQNLEQNAEFVVGSTVVYYLNGVAINHTEKNCKNLIAAASYYAKYFPSFLTANTLNAWSWTIFEHSNDKEELRQALEWSKYSNELESTSPEFIDTYANLLYKLGLTHDAIIWQKKAIQQLKEKKYQNLAIQQALEKMQKGEKTWP